jgi:hypothetical protein
MDGSPAGKPPVELEGVGQAVVLTHVEAVSVDAVAPASAVDSCLQEWSDDGQSVAPVVRRVGVHTESVTFRDASGMWVFGCDESTGPRENERRWCGGAAGRLYDGRLRDPRVDILCTTDDGDRVGFAWLEPSPGARYVVVDQPGYAEVYEAAGDMPIRIATTSGVIVQGSRAQFALSEHARDGSLIRERELEAGVAG